MEAAALDLIAYTRTSAVFHKRLCISRGLSCFLVGIGRSTRDLNGPTVYGFGVSRAASPRIASR